MYQIQELLGFVEEEWGIKEEEAAFHTFDHPSCQGQLTKIHKSAFGPHLTAHISTIYVSKKTANQEEGKCTIVDAHAALVAPAVERWSRETAQATTTNDETNIADVVSCLLALSFCTPLMKPRRSLRRRQQ